MGKKREEHWAIVDLVGSTPPDDGKAEASAAEPGQEQAAIREWKLLGRDTCNLLGPPPQHRTVRIMLTMPSEAAGDFGLVRDLVVNGMDCMLVNCTHDGPVETARPSRGSCGQGCQRREGRSSSGRSRSSSA
jgi:hypothetical protein